MKERRRATRHRCRLRAEICRGGQRLEALLLDVSLSGLSLQSGIALAQGDPVELAVEGGVRVKALAWHAHRLKRPGTPTYKIGMMLAEVGPAYEALVARVAGGARSRVVTLAAPTKEAAVAGSLAEVGPDWEVVDVVSAS